METKNASKLITERIIQMMDRRGLSICFGTNENREIRSHEDAYEVLENEYFAVMGRRRYLNFKSFKRRRDE